MAAYDLSGRVALVTGAARGIGLETARALHSRGASVAVCDLDPEATEEAASEIGPDVLALPADVADSGAMEEAVEQTVDRFGGLDIPIANAGVAPPTATMRVIDPDAFERTIEIDLLGVWRTVRPALPHVVERRGQVVVVSSVYAWVNGVVNASYAISKAGVEQLGRSLRVELAPHGASATVAHFGFVDTAMVRNALEDPVARRFEEAFPRWVRGRITPAEAAGTIVSALERRSPRVVAPAWWRVWYALRGILNPIVDRAMPLHPRVAEVLAEADADDRASLRGGLETTAGDRTA